MRLKRLPGVVAVLDPGLGSTISRFRKLRCANCKKNTIEVRNAHLVQCRAKEALCSHLSAARSADGSFTISVDARAAEEPDSLDAVMDMQERIAGDFFFGNIQAAAVSELEFFGGYHAIETLPGKFYRSSYRSVTIASKAPRAERR